MNVRVRQGDFGEGLGGMAHFSLCGAQKLAPHWRVEEQIVHLDGGADPTAAGCNCLGVPAVYDDLCAGLRICRPAA